MANTSGYIPGKGRTFTPSYNATWTDSFNEIMIEQKFSRNKLTEKLIEDGIKYNKLFSEDNVLPLSLPEGLSEEQIKVIKSDQGLKMISNFIGVILGGGFEIQNNQVFQNLSHQNKEESTQHEASYEKVDTMQDHVNMNAALNDSKESISVDNEKSSITPNIETKDSKVSTNTNVNPVLANGFKKKGMLKFKSND